MLVMKTPVGFCLVRGLFHDKIVLGSEEKWELNNGVMLELS